MAQVSRLAGTTSQIEEVLIQDSSSTAGGGLTGLLYNTSGLTCYYKRNTASASVAVTLANITTLGTYVSGGFKLVDNTNMPGIYEFHPPDAALASGADQVVFVFRGASSMAESRLIIELTAVNNQSATSFITGINSLAPPTNWNSLSIDGSGRVDVIKINGTSQTARDLGASVLLSSGTGTGQISLSSGKVTPADPYSTVAHSGTAQAGASTTITLANTASSQDGIYIGSRIKIYSGTGAGQARTITAYDGITNVATVDRGWAINPDATSVYAVEYTDSPTLNSTLQMTAASVQGNVTGTIGNLASGAKTDVENAVWEATGSSHVTAGTTGKELSNASAAGDPWATALPGAYASGTAGNIVGNNLDAAVSSRLATSGYTVPPTTAQIATGVWTDTTASDFTTASSPGKAVLTNLDTTVSSRLATASYTVAPTAAAVATAVWQDLTAGSDFTTLNSVGKMLVTNIDAAVSTRLASSAITLSGGAVTVGTNNDKTGYSLTQTFPTNFADLAITATTGEVTVGTNNDKTGYTASTVSDKTGYTLSTAGLAAFFTTNSGATYASAVAGSVVKETADNSGGSSAPTAAQNAAAVWDLTLSGHEAAGSTGAALAAAQSAGDPWSTAIPGAYGAGTAGNVVGNALADINSKTFNKTIFYIASALCGNLTESLDHTSTTIDAFNNAGTTAITSVNANDGTNLTRTPTLS